MSGFEQKLTDEALERALSHDSRRIAIVGLTAAATRVRRHLIDAGLGARVVGVFDPTIEGPHDLARPWTELPGTAPDLIVVATDEHKEDALLAVNHAIVDRAELPQIVVAGTAHLTFSDPVYEQLDAPALVPSYATGYPHTRVHIYQCLRAAAANRLEGAVVEFGAFKGGTTAWLARVVRYFGLSSRIIAFDSWSGFPARRSILDLYTHPRCEFTGIEDVRAHLEPLGVELVVGDISETAPERLAAEPILLAFVDTDNYSPARAALTAVVPNLIVGGAIVFDHYETSDEYVYTLGERIAGKEMLADSGLLQIHGTGVFVKLAEEMEPGTSTDRTLGLESDQERTTDGL